MGDVQVSLRELHPVDDAIALLKRSHIRLEAEDTEVWRATGRVAAEAVRAPRDLPPLDRSVLDGYAVRWTDIAAASEDSPVYLHVSGSVDVGEMPRVTLKPGHAVRVSTGSYIPAGADTVVPLEFTMETSNGIAVFRPVASGYGVAVRGEDLREGETILKPGDVIEPGHAALLSAIGKLTVKVWRPLKAALLVVGDEIIPPGVAGSPGSVNDSTGVLVQAWLESHNIKVLHKIYLQDNLDIIASTVNNLVDVYDIVFTTGGTSVGKKDATVKALQRISDDIVHGLRLTPGRPGGVALVKGKPVIMLSGMPVAAFSELIAVFDPFYRGLMGRGDPWEPVVEAVLTRKYASHPGFVNVVRSRSCVSKGRVYLEPLRVTGSGILSTLVRANSYFLVPEEVTGLDEGEVVEARILRGLPRC